MDQGSMMCCWSNQCMLSRPVLAACRCNTRGYVAHVLVHVAACTMLSAQSVFVLPGSWVIAWLNSTSNSSQCYRRHQLLPQNLGQLYAVLRTVVSIATWMMLQCSSCLCCLMVEIHCAELSGPGGLVRAGTEGVHQAQHAPPGADSQQIRPDAPAGC